MDPMKPTLIVTNDDSRIRIGLAIQRIASDPTTAMRVEITLPTPDVIAFGMHLGQFLRAMVEPLPTTSDHHVTHIYFAVLEPRLGLGHVVMFELELMGDGVDGALCSRQSVGSYLLTYLYEPWQRTLLVAPITPTPAP
jgi:hypothetical protein